MKASAPVLTVLVTLMATYCFSHEMRWDHSVDLDENFRMLWKVKESDIIVELQVRTLGYVGFGFARSEYIYGADMVIGWVDKNTFFQVSRNTFSVVVALVTTERECKKLLFVIGHKKL